MISNDNNEDKLSKIYDTIAGHINSDKGQCILLLGPELLVNHEGKSYKQYFKDIAESNKASIRYFDNENLFAFHDSTAEKKIILDAKSFYSNAGDMALMEMISRIKFPFIINSCSDVSLNNVYKDRNISFQSGYFSTTSKPLFNDIKYPSKELPVVYNIFGSIENDQALILTHGKMFKTIEHLMPKGSLPDELEKYLDNASSFIFLGFKFDSWYYQLLCHKLKIRANSKTNLGVPNCDNESVNFIMRKHFEMAFTHENPVQTVQRIIKSCEVNNPSSLRLKKPVDAYSVFVSYALNDDQPKDSKPADREIIVDWIEQQLKKRKTNIQFLRDKNTLTYGDSLDSFMHRIGTGKTVIRVISDKYFKSRFCMDEALRIKKYNDNDKRVFTILLDDIVAQSEQSSFYKKYWRDKCETVLNDIDENIADLIEREILKRKYGVYIDVYGFVDVLIADLQDQLYFKASHEDMYRDEQKKINVKPERLPAFEEFLETIIKKIEEE